MVIISSEMEQSNLFLFLYSEGDRQKLQSMSTQVKVPFRIRTEDSQEFSLASNELTLNQSIDSVSLPGDYVSYHIQQLHKVEQNREQSRSKGSSRSYIMVRDHNQQNSQRKKTLSMTGVKKPEVNLKDLPHASLTKLLSYHRLPKLAKTELYNRAHGAMMGLLIGDSMGSYLINRPFSPAQISEAIMMNGGGTMGLKSGQGTDEWEICLALSQALIQGKGNYDSNIVASKYLNWLESSPSDLPVLMGVAFTDIRKKKHHQRGVINRRTIGAELKKGSMKNRKQESNLGLIRILPLVIWGIHLDECQFNHLIREQMSLITPNQFVLETSLLFANILKCILTTGDHCLAYHQAAQSVYNFGSQRMVALWKQVEESSSSLSNMNYNSGNATHLRFPFLLAVNEMLEIDLNLQDPRKQFIDSAVRTLSKGFNTDTNCSVVLGLVGGIIGYSNIPSYFVDKLLHAPPSRPNPHCTDYSSSRVVGLVSGLLKEAPVMLDIDM